VPKVKDFSYFVKQMERSDSLTLAHFKL